MPRIDSRTPDDALLALAIKSVSKDIKTKASDLLTERHGAELAEKMIAKAKKEEK